MNRRSTLRVLAGGAAVLSVPTTLGGCGFHLRGDASYPFSTLFIANEQKTLFYGELKRTLTGLGHLKLVDRPEGAEAILELTPPNPIDDKSILALSGGGRVREFQLTKRVVFRVRDAAGLEWLPTSEIVIRRDFSFNDTQALAKENEERLLLEDMQNDAVRQIARRLQLAKRPG